MSARMRVTRAHTGNRRSHHALKEPRLSTCGKCGAHHLRHRMCPECGTYRNRLVVDVLAKKTARLQKRDAKFQTDEPKNDSPETESAPEKKKVSKQSKTTPKKESSEAPKKTVKKKSAATAKKSDTEKAVSTKK